MSEEKIPCKEIELMIEPEYCLIISLDAKCECIHKVNKQNNIKVYCSLCRKDLTGATATEIMKHLDEHTEEL